MKQIIALAIFVCASYGAQAQTAKKTSTAKPAQNPPAQKAANTETRTGQVAPMPETRTGQIAPMPTITPITSGKKKN